MKPERKGLIFANVPVGNCKRIPSGTENSLQSSVGTRRAVSADLRQGTFRWKRSTGTFQGRSAAGHRAERSCSLRPRKAIAFSHPPSTCARKHGHGDFAVCGRRLRGTPLRTPRQLCSVGSAFRAHGCGAFCPCTMIFVPAPVISQHVRSALEKLPLFVPFSVCPEAWARGFRRLRTAT